ncbi:VOC family protein [Nocardioides sp. LHG3406-4]|uniref:VOC family protein n=1 Tax=Nocardioides sp. LHG3406-4 TaxID=2804575 RepID=UPI003CEB02DF
MASRLNPYISFKDNAAEALAFYQSVLGGELESHTFGEYADPAAPEVDLLMHGQLETPAGFTIMAADTPPGMEHRPGENVAVSLSGDDVTELRQWYAGLSAGGTVIMPLEMQMWGDEFGMFNDRFGVPWMVNIAGAAV